MPTILKYHTFVDGQINMLSSPLPHAATFVAAAVMQLYTVGIFDQAPGTRLTQQPAVSVLRFLFDLVLLFSLAHHVTFFLHVRMRPMTFYILPVVSSLFYSCCATAVATPTDADPQKQYQQPVH